ncbi:MAG: ECF-type riboflavin transporter substrate-binding protein [Oscillospiraceae bacterium]|nr:ECF-type riboflavin transporter substrate-binding protein [Oscillospiraceae bacterium]
MKKSPIVTVVAIGIGAALFFVLGRFVAIPSPVPNTNIALQYGLLAFMTMLFGPFAGMLIALIGHALIDFSYGWGIWWSWVIASGVFGLVFGLLSKGNGTSRGLNEGKFSGGDIIRFNVSQILAHLVSWGLVAPTLDVLMFAEPANKVYLQCLVGGVSNIVTTGIIGTILCIAYAAAKPKKGSLKEEK